MLAAALALIVAGLLLMMLLGPFALLVVGVGVVLLVLALVGFGRRSAEGRP